MKKNENNEIPWIKKMGKNDAKTRLKYVSTIYTGNSMNEESKKNNSNNKCGINYISTKDIDNNLSVNYNSGIKVNDGIYKFSPINSILLCIEGGRAGKKKHI